MIPQKLILFSCQYYRTIRKGEEGIKKQKVERRKLHIKIGNGTRG